MSSHECKQEEFIGRVKEFIENSKGVRGTLFVIAMAIAVQVGTFLYLWGGLTTTVKYHDGVLDAIYNKLDKVKFISYSYADEDSSKKQEE